MVTSAGLTAPPPSAPRVINVTSDSAPGWMPSEELEAEARETFRSYFLADARGDDAAVWAMAGEGLKAGTSFAAFRAGNQERRKGLGKLKAFTVLQLTWTKDPAAAPSPGIYAAIDFAASSSKTMRQCGYVVLFKATEAVPFRVTRIENNIMTNAVYAKVAKDKSKAEADQLWSQLSANCPNYKPAS
jgi:hypothetical protein